MALLPFEQKLLAARRRAPISWAFLLGLLVAGLGNTFIWEAKLKPQQEEQLTRMYRRGFEAGVRAERERKDDYKTLALNDHRFSQNLCTAWWFGSTAKERKLR